MKFDENKAIRWYRKTFLEGMRDAAIAEALDMSEEDFEAAAPGIDPESGEYLPSPFSAGEWDAIDYARN